MDIIRSLILTPLLGGPPYLAFFSLLMGCSIGFPFSSDITLITAGVLSGAGIFELKKAVLLGISAILMGDTLAFYAGRKFGQKIVRHRYFLRICPPSRFDEISGFLNQNASKFIFMVRFTPGMRSAIFLTAGSVGVPPSTFFKMNALSTSLYVPVLMYLSYLATNNAEELVREFQTYNTAIAFVLVAFIGSLFYYRNRRRKKVRV